MQRLEVSGAVRHIYGSLGFKRLIALFLDPLWYSSLLLKCMSVSKKHTDHNVAIC